MEKEEKKVVLSTFYEGFAVKQAILKLSPEKVIFLISDPPKAENKEKMLKELGLIEDFYKKEIQFEKFKISSYDISKIMKEVIIKIDEEYDKGNKILIHITEGRKTSCLATLFAAYMRREKIEGAYYITEEEHNLITLPLLNFQINNTKKEMLRKISEGNKDVISISGGSDLGKSAIYQNLKELKQEGYIAEVDKELVLTDLGKIMIL